MTTINVNSHSIKQQKIGNNFNINFQRPVCIHSSLQFVDLCLQSLLYCHSFISAPVATIQNISPNTSKTLNAFESIRNELRDVFKSKFRKSIKNVLLIVGPSSLNPIFTYEIPIKLCEANDTTNTNCGDTCGELNDSERRRINRDLFMMVQKLDTSHKKFQSKNNRIFVYINSKDDIVGENIEEDEPAITEKCVSSRLCFNHNTCQCAATEVESTRWMRISPFIVYGKE